MKDGRSQRIHPFLGGGFMVVEIPDLRAKPNIPGIRSQPPSNKFEGEVGLALHCFKDGAAPAHRPQR